MDDVLRPGAGKLKSVKFRVSASNFEGLLALRQMYYQPLNTTILVTIHLKSLSITMYPINETCLSLLGKKIVIIVT